MRTRLLRSILSATTIIGSLLSTGLSAAQTETLPPAGLSAFTPFQHSDIDSVNLATGNVNVHIPLISFPQKGSKLRMNFVIRYNEPEWTYSVSSIFTNFLSSPQVPARYEGAWILGNASTTNRPLGVDVVRDQGITETQSTSTHMCLGDFGVGPSGVPFGEPVNCNDPFDDPNSATLSNSRSNSTNYNLRDRTGAEHTMGTLLSKPFLYTGFYFTATAPDGSGWSPAPAGYPNVIDSNGVKYTSSPITLINGTTSFSRAAYTVSDDHGNQILTTANGWTDSVGRSIPGSWNGPGTGGGTDPTIYGLTYEDDPYPGVMSSDTSACGSNTTAERIWNVPYQDGSNVNYYFCFTTMSSNTAFDVTTVNGYPAIGQEANGGTGQLDPVSALLLTKVILPNNTSYEFHYNSDYLDLSEIDFPTGGKVVYGYNTPDGTGTIAWNGCTTSSPRKRVVTSRSLYDSYGVHTWYYTWGHPGCQGNAVSIAVRIQKPDGNDELQLTVPAIATSPGGAGGPATTTNGYQVTTHFNGSMGGTPDSPTGDIAESVYTEQVALLSPFFGTNAPPPDEKGGLVPGIYTYQEVTSGPTVRTITTFRDGSYKEKDSSLVASGGNILFEDPGDPAGTPPATPGTSPHGGYCACLNYSAIAETREYDFHPAGSATVGSSRADFYPLIPGTLLRKTDTTYAFDDGGTHASSYTAANLLDLPSSIKVYDHSSTTPLAQTTYSYDENSIVAGVTLSAGGTAGDLTSTSRWKTGNTWVTTHTAYNSNGEVTAQIDALGTLASQVASFECSGLLPHLIYLGSGTSTQESETYTHDCTTGHITSYGDPNGKLSTFTYDDPGYLNRLTQASYPDGGSVSIAYTDGSSSQIQLTTASGTTEGSQVQTVYYDALGRTKSVHTASSAGDVIQDTTYDGLGRKYTVSNPYLAMSDATYGLTTYSYDTLSRPSQVENPDSSVRTWIYPNSQSYGSYPAPASSGSTTYEVDETGVMMQTTIDGLGHLTFVNDAAPCSGATSGNIASYAYDALGNLLSVSQTSPSGCGETPRSRSFVYDGLSELTQSTNPETGAIHYFYDANGNLTEKDSPDPNLSSGGGTVTCYAYDALNRLTSRAYYASTGCSSPTGWSDAFSYGTSSSSANSIGRLTLSQANDSAGTYATTSGQTYDPMGRLLSEQQLTPSGGSYIMNYTYDYMGHIVTSSNGMPSGSSPATFTYSYDSAARLSAITSNWEDSTHPTKLFDASGSNSYGAMGLLNASLAVNNTTLLPAISLARTIDKRGRVLAETDTGQAESSTGLPSTGSIVLSGGTGLGAVAATGSFQIEGDEDGKDYRGTYDHGTVSIIVGSYGATASYGASSSSNSLATALANTLNLNFGGMITATVSGGTIYIMANSPGPVGDYTMNFSCHSQDVQWDGEPSFCPSPSGSSMTGGRNADTGTVSATINGVTSTVSWTSSSTVSTLATALASAIQSEGGGNLTASASGGTINLQSTNIGSGTNWSIGVTATDTAGNGTPGFSLSHSGMSGGTDPGFYSGPIYSYSIPSGSGGYDGVGDLLSVSDLVMGNWSFSGGYDTLHRLVSGSASSGPYSGWQACWNYDSFGNRTLEAVGTGSCNPATTSPTASYDANNHLAWTSVGGLSNGPGYSAAGNTLSDGAHSFTYDQEGRICAVYDLTLTTTTKYLYDASGNRVAKGSGGDHTNCSRSGVTWTYQYLLGQAGEDVTELDGSGHWQYTNVYGDGKLLATYRGSDTYFGLSDWLGTKRAEAREDGKICATYQSLPYGNSLIVNSTGVCANDDPSEQHFTGKERDAESGLDYFGARYYASSMGRWMSPDPSNWGVDFTNPQTWNHYSYVANNPLSNTDPNGLWLTPTHNSIINNSFPGLSKEQRQILQASSKEVDTHQGQDDQYMHGMDSSHDNVWEGAYNPEIGPYDYIQQNEHDAKEIQAEWIASGHTGIAPAALAAFGNALHTITDEYSPSHAGFQQVHWYSYPLHWREGLAMVGMYGNSTRSAQAAARTAFYDVFGSELGEQATHEKVTVKIIFDPNQKLPDDQKQQQ